MSYKPSILQNMTHLSFQNYPLKNEHVPEGIVECFSRNNENINEYHGNNNMKSTNIISYSINRRESAINLNLTTVLNSAHLVSANSKRTTWLYGKENSWLRFSDDTA